MYQEFFNNLEPLKSQKNPTLAFIIGFLFGGIGLGIYFFSLIDFFIPIAISLFLGVLFPGIGFLGGAFIAGFWGYYRSVISNKKLRHNNFYNTYQYQHNKDEENIYNQEDEENIY